MIRIPSKYDDKLYRFDLLQKLVSYDEKTHLAIMEYIPNPDRYEWKMIGGEEYLCDKMEPFRCTKERFFQMLRDLKGKTLYYVKPDIDNISNYIELQIPKIKKFLVDDNAMYEFKDKSEEFLQSLSKDNELTFVILCIDIVGSTKLSEQLSPQENAKIIQVFSKELAFVVDAYHGFILKYVGDGLIAYFPEPNHLGMEDNAVDCAVTMKFLIERGLNKALKEHGLPELQFRIGLDTGEAIVSTIGNPASKQHKDLIGQTINFAAKIQSSAQPNQIIIGESTKKQLHTTRKKMFDAYNSKNWNYHHSDKDSIYQLFSLSNTVEPHPSQDVSQITSNGNTTSGISLEPNDEQSKLIEKYSTMTKRLMLDLKSISKINPSCVSDLKMYDNFIKFSNRCLNSNMTIAHILMKSEEEFLDDVKKYGIDKNTIDNLYFTSAIHDSNQFYTMMEFALGTLLKGVSYDSDKKVTGTESLEEIKEIINSILPDNSFFWDEIDIVFKNALMHKWYYIKNNELMYFENAQLDNSRRLLRTDLIEKLEGLTPMVAGIFTAVGNWPRDDDPDFLEIGNF